MRKSKIIYLLVAGMLLFVLPVSVWAYTFNDTDLVQPWQNGAPTGGGFQDVIGLTSIFQTYGANLSGNTLTIFTQWKPANDGYLGFVLTSDLFIKNNTTGILYAIGTDTVGQGNLYSNVTTNFLTSDDVTKSHTGDTYGGRDNQFGVQAVPVEATGTFTTSSRVQWILGFSDPEAGVTDNKLVVDLTGLIGNDWSFVWGTGDCSNDAIRGAVQPQVPEPGIMLLLGLGLVGLAGLRRKFKN